MQFSVDGEEVVCDIFLGGGEESGVIDDGADAVVEGFVMGVEGEENGVGWEGGDAF